jgi:hypothetical protein
MNNRYGKSSVHVWPVCDSRATLASAVSLRFIQVILAVHNQPTNQSINQSITWYWKYHLHTNVEYDRVRQHSAYRAGATVYKDLRAE